MLKKRLQNHNQHQKQFLQPTAKQILNHNLNKNKKRPEKN